MGRKWFFILFLLPVFGLGQVLSGTWDLQLDILPSVSFVSTSLQLDYSVSGWTIDSTSDFYGTDGWVWQGFGLHGSLAPGEMEWEFLFGPLAPAFLYSQGKVSLPESGVTLYSGYVGPNVPGYAFTGGPSGGLVAVIEREVEGTELTAEVGFGARLRPFKITYSGIGTYERTYDVDPFPGGFKFTYAELSAEGIPFCCGMTIDGSLSFTKEEGFEYLKLVVHDLVRPCCDISVDASVTLATDSKEISVEPRWKGIEGCLTVYGDVQYTGGKLEGLELYGWKAVCRFGDCNSLELLTALDAAKIEEILAEDIFQADEFEYIKLSICGPGCCGGDYSLGITAYFRGTVGSLLGISRVLIDASVPLMEDLLLNGSLEIAVPGGPSLSLGWEFTF